MTETPFDSNLLRKWWKHFELRGSTLIWAPRQSGKTFAMVRKMVEDPNAIICVPRSPMKSTIYRILEDLGCPNRKRDVFTMRNDALLGRQASTIFIDEIDMFNGDLEQWWMAVRPTVADRGRIIACSTPAGVRPRGYYDCFHNQLGLNDIYIRKIKDHFENEKELFEV